MDNFEISDESRQFIDEKTAEYYHTQSSERLNSLVEAQINTTGRAYSLFAGIITVIGIATALIANIPYMDWLMIISLCIMILSGFLCIFLLCRFVISTYDMRMKGRDPKDLQIERYAKYYNTPDKRIYVNTLLDEVVAIEDNINRNMTELNRRTHNLNRCIKIIAFAIPISGVLMLIGLIL